MGCGTCVFHPRIAYERTGVGGENKRTVLHMHARGPGPGCASDEGFHGDAANSSSSRSADSDEVRVDSRTPCPATASSSGHLGHVHACHVTPQAAGHGTSPLQTQRASFSPTASNHSSIHRGPVRSRTCSSVGALSLPDRERCDTNTPSSPAAAAGAAGAAAVRGLRSSSSFSGPLFSRSQLGLPHLSHGVAELCLSSQGGCALTEPQSSLPVPADCDPLALSAPLPYTTVLTCGGAVLEPAVVDQLHTLVYDQHKPQWDAPAGSSCYTDHPAPYPSFLVATGEPAVTPAAADTTSWSDQLPLSGLIPVAGPNWPHISGPVQLGAAGMQESCSPFSTLSTQLDNTSSPDPSALLQHTPPAGPGAWDLLEAPSGSQHTTDSSCCTALMQVGLSYLTPHTTPQAGLDGLDGHRSCISAPLPPVCPDGPALNPGDGAESIAALAHVKMAQIAQLKALQQELREQVLQLLPLL